MFRECLRLLIKGRMMFLIDFKKLMYFILISGRLGVYNKF